MSCVILHESHLAPCPPDIIANVPFSLLIFITQPSSKPIGSQSRKSAKLFLQSSELGLSHPFSRRRVCPPPFGRGEGYTRLRERGWESPSSDDRTAYKDYMESRRCSAGSFCSGTGASPHRLGEATNLPRPVIRYFLHILPEGSVDQ